MKKRIAIIGAIVFVLLAGVVGGYYAITGKTPIDTVLSVFVNEPGDSKAVKAGKELNDAATLGDIKKASTAIVELNAGLSECLATDPSSVKCAELQKSAADKYGSALVAGGKKFLSNEKVAAMERPTSVTSAQPEQFTRLVPEPISPIVSISNSCYAQINGGSNQLTPDCFAEMQQAIRKGGGTVIAQPRVIEEIRPIVEPSLKPLDPMIVNPTPLAETSRTVKANNEFSSPTCTVELKGTKLIELRKNLEKLEKAGKLSATQRCELRTIRQGWRERKALMAQK